MAAESLSSTFTGQVASVNPKGLRLDGHTDWLNYSRFAVGIVPPERGQTVTVTLDRQGFVRAVEIAEGGSGAISGQNGRSHAAPELSGASGAAGRDLRELRIIRQSCLKAAVERAAGRPDVSTSDVIRIAEAFERWVLRPYDGDELVDAF